MLTAMQMQLEAHYASLARSREAIDAPVYALEHGLDGDSLTALAQAARTELWTTGPRDVHWLVWTAVAAEAGYNYAGDEYWPALEALTGDWRNNNNRTWLRRRFARFADRYRGPVPVGRWAQHFSIISWPIANAILPRYLQALFARHLYDLRHHLADLAPSGTTELGRLLSDSYDGASPRFADFLQQTDLTTQIVLALRDADQADAVSRISPDLFRRIVSDLEARPESRSFLRAARKVISERRARVGSRLLPVAGGHRRATDPSPGIARLGLAARRDGTGAALFGMIFPDVPAALAQARLDAAALDSVRMRLQGGTWEPGETLLTFARRDHRLDAMPPAGQAYAELSGGAAGLRALIEPLLILDERICWVLRQHNDGLYRQVARGHVRPGQHYLVAARAPLSGDVAAAGLIACASRTDGLHVYSLDLGDRFAPGQRDALAALGIGSSTTLHLVPVGFNPAIDPSTTLPAWQPGQAVMLLATTGDVVTHLKITLDDDPACRVAVCGNAACFALDDLTIGQHLLSVVAERDGVEVGEPARFAFLIAPPRPWPETMRQAGGFRLYVTPASASLEEIFSGAASLRVLGPAGRTIHWSLETYDAEGHVATMGAGGTTTVGADSSLLASVINRLRTTYSDAIDIAHRVDIVAAAGELGRQAVAFPHAVEPVRWVFDPVRHCARLVDETDHETPIRVRSYPLAAPLAKEKMALEAATQPFAIASPGALLIADFQNRNYSLFASAPVSTSARSFGELALSQDFACAGTLSERVARLVAAYRRWKSARPVGQLALVRKQTTLSRLFDEIAAAACGADFWSPLRTPDATSLQWAQGQVRGSPGFAFRLRTQAMSNDIDQARDAFAREAIHYAIEQDRQRCDDAFLLAFAPETVRLGRLGEATRKMDCLLANRSLLRGAFLARAARGQNDAAPRQVAAQ